jgi:hypothetical protein
MRILFLLLFITACNSGGGGGSSTPVTAAISDEVINELPPSDPLVSKHYKVSMLANAGRTFSGTLCGQDFTGDEFECDATSLDLDFHSDGSDAFRLLIEVDSVTEVDDLIPRGVKHVGYKESL